MATAGEEGTTVMKAVKVMNAATARASLPRIEVSPKGDRPGMVSRPSLMSCRPRAEPATGGLYPRWLTAVGVAEVQRSRPTDSVRQAAHEYESPPKSQLDGPPSLSHEVSSQWVRVG